MPNQVSGLLGYNFYLINSDGVTYTKLNDLPLAESAPYIASNLLPGTDYRGKLFITSVDLAGNETAKVPYTDVATQTGTTGPGGSALSSTYRTGIDSIAARAITAGCGPRLTIGVVSPLLGNYVKTYGGVGTDADHFRAASQSKSFVGATVLRAITAGLISLTDPLSTYLPGYAVDPTIAQLLSMRSGIFDYEGNSALATNFTLTPTYSYTNAQIIALIKAGTTGRTHASEFAPGSTYYYTNSNYFLLAKIVEAVDPSHRSIGDIITQDLFIPLGMVNSYCETGTQVPQSPYSPGYDFNPIAAFIGLKLRRDVSNQNSEVVGPAGFVVSTISDMLLWGQELRDGTLISPTLHSLRDTSFPTSMDIPAANRYGFNKTGPDHYEYGYGSLRVGALVGHDGSWLGYDSVTMYEPSTGTVISVFENFQTTGLLSLALVLYEVANLLHPGSADYTNFSTRQGISATIPKMGSSSFVQLPAPFTETNMVRTNSPVPLNPSSPTAGCWVTLRGGNGGGAPGAGDINQTGGGGGNGGGYTLRYWIPVSLLGSTYSTAWGRGGASNQDGTDSVFSSGTVALTANGGPKGSPATATYQAYTAPSVGGSWSAVNLPGATGFNGSPGGQGYMQNGLPGSPNTNGAGAGGGGGGGNTVLGIGLGGAGGVTPNGAGGVGGNSTSGHPAAGTAGANGTDGGGGGGGGGWAAPGGLGGSGSDGEVIVEWVA